jgi:hypothetical protein
MGVTKKATIVAKTATKKRGRPAGSKNKATLLSSTGWVPPTPVDYKKLLDETQHALAIEMKTNEALQGLFDNLKAKVTLDKDVSIWTRLKFLVTGRL